MEHEYIAEIQRNFPELEISSITLLGEGWMNIAFLVNDRYVFRFANTERANRELRTEICLLPKLRGVLKLQIPKFKFSGTREKNGFAFVGYDLITGIPFHSKVFNSLNNEHKEDVLKKLAEFFLDLHGFSKKEATLCGVLEVDYKEFATRIFSEAQSKVFPLINTKEREYIVKIFGDYILNEENFNYTPVLVYADSKPDHLLFNTQKNELTGIIDWGNVRIGDPDHDFKHLFMSFGEDFIQELLKYYPHPNPDNLIQKLRLFSKTDAVIGVLHGINNSKPDFVDTYLKQITEMSK